MNGMKRLICMLLVTVMLGGMLPVSAVVNSDVPETDVPPMIEEPRRTDAPETLPERPENNVEQLALTETVSGTCGEKLTWTLTTDGTLTISGTGEMEDYGYSSKPWSPYQYSILHVVVEDGVTSIGSRAFAEFSSLLTASIGKDVTFLFRTFERCTSLTEIKVDSRNQSYCTMDGVLFTKSKDMIVTYPAGKAGTSYVIPSSVTVIAPAAFYGSNLAGVTIPSGVTSIGNHSFANCYDLASITLPKALETIETQAFMSCDSLTSVTIPASVTYMYRAFDYCKNLAEIIVESGNSMYCSVGGVLFNKDKTRLMQYPAKKAGTSYVVPDSVTYIGEYAFCDCTNLASITLPDDLTAISYGMFSGCTSLKSITLPAGVTSIGDSAFSGCTSLAEINVAEGNQNYASIDGVLYDADKTTLLLYPTGKTVRSYTIPKGVTSIGDSAFEQVGLVEVTIGNNVKTIGYNAFSQCDSLERVTIGDSVESIGNHVFWDCDSLVSVKLGEGVETIGSRAFWGCDSLADLTIGAGVTTISEHAFNWCYALKTVRYTGSEKQWNKITIESGNDALTSALILFLADMGDTIASGTCGDNMDWVLAMDGTLTITGTGWMDDFDYYHEWNNTGGAPWVAYRELITKAVISDGVVYIGDYAFSGCAGLTEVTLPNSVTGVGSETFSGCKGLVEIDLPDDMIDIGWHAFYNCTGLSEITIPKTVVQIEDGAFSSCSALTKITVESGNYKYCTVNGVLFTKDKTTLMQYPAGKTVTSYTIPDSVKSIQSEAFNGCANLVSIKIPDSVTSMYGSSMFENCSSLTTVVLPDGITSIGFNMFFGCESLENVTLPDSVTSIGLQAFWGCESLESIVLPTSVTRIGQSAFCYCSSLESIVLPNSVTCIEEAVFYRCTSLEWIAIPKSVTYIGSYAFDFCDALKTVCFAGTEKQWNAIEIEIEDDGNAALLNAKILFESSSPLVAPAASVKLNSSDKPVVSWNAVEGAEKYEVWRAVEGGKYTKLWTGTGRKMTNTSAVAGTTYSYKVRAVLGSSYSKYSNTVSITVPSPVATPVVTVTLNDNDKPVITWNAVDGAEQYEVWRAVGTGEYKLLKTMTGRKLTHTSAEAGQTYSYKVRALAGGIYSVYSAVKSITVPIDLGTPTLSVSNKASSGKVVLSWSKIDGAEKYEIWSSTSKNGTYKRLWTGSGTSVNHNSATEGVTYYYKVRAVAGSVCGEFSAIKSRACDLAQPVVTVSNNASTGKVVLSWEKIEGAAKYEVYRSTSKDGTYTKLWTGTGTKLTNSSTEPGVTYYYKVRALHATNTSATSAYSEVKSRTCDCARPGVTITLNSKGQPVLTWNKVEGAVKYEVYRSTSKNGTYSLLWSGTVLKLTNSSVKAGTTYYYKVKAICSVSSGNSAYSTVKSVTAK